MAKTYSNQLTSHNTNHGAALKLSRWLDNAIPLPGGFRIGLDGIIGLIPGVGDAVGGALSLLILHEAYKRRVPKMILLRMTLNVVIDMTIGAIPILGDIFDFFWKANAKNVQLLEDYDYAPKKTYRKASAVSALILVIALTLMAFLAWLTWQIAEFLWATVIANV